MTHECKMVESGVEWIGQIPEYWSVCRIGALATLRAGKAISADNLTDTGFPVYGSNGIRGFSPHWLVDGDYWLIGRQGSAGEINHASGKFWPSEHALVVRHDETISHEYLGYSLMAADLSQYVGGTAQPGLAASFIAQVPVSLPPITDQWLIATYLNHHVGLIDREKELVANKISLLNDKRQALIFECVTGKQTIVERDQLTRSVKGNEILYADDLAAAPTALLTDFGIDGEGIGLVDSGVDWIGEIPDCWRVVKMKEVSTVNPKTKLPAFGSVSFIPMERLFGGAHSIEETKPLPELGSYTKFSDGDVLVAKVTPCFENGKIAVAKYLVGGVGLGSSEITPIRPNGICGKYLMRVMQSQPFIDAGCATMNGTAGLQRVASWFWKDTEIPLPNLKEQKAISNFLDKAAANIDLEVDFLARKMSLLEARRKALIFEAVTGKLDVHGQP